MTIKEIIDFWNKKNLNIRLKEIKHYIQSQENVDGRFNLDNDLHIWLYFMLRIKKVLTYKDLPKPINSNKIIYVQKNTGLFWNKRHGFYIDKFDWCRLIFMENDLYKEGVI